jgi:Ca2+-dependent lipid-binding protein
LINKEKGLVTLPHAYCVLQYDGRKCSTKPSPEVTQDPTWDEEFRFPVFTAGNPLPFLDPEATNNKLELICYDRDKDKDTIIGDVLIELDKCFIEGEYDGENAPPLPPYETTYLLSFRLDYPLS